jgi:hypothetical protein
MRPISAGLGGFLGIGCRSGGHSAAMRAATWNGVEQMAGEGLSLRNRFPAMALILAKAVRSYPGRDWFNGTVRSLRRSVMRKLPHVGAADFVTYVEPCRGPDDGVGAKSASHSSHGPRTEMLRRFDGTLSLDAKSHHIFHDCKVIWGSTDQIGRDRNPRVVGFVLRPKRHVDECISLRGGFENNYFHFFFDTIPKLLLAERHVAERVPVVVGESLAKQPFFRDAVDAGLFRSRPVLVQKRHEQLSAGRIWVPTPRDPTRSDLLEMVRRLTSAVPVERGALRLYVTRGNAARNARRLNNEAELLVCLRNYGFEAFDPQEHSLAGQIARFSQAEIILSPHGAALTNLIWRQAKSLKVIELFNPRFRIDCYEQMSAVMGCDYWSVDNLNCSGRAFREAGDADIARIDQLLAEIAGPKADQAASSASHPADAILS